tara:strand:- start:913 stop:1395 length:483 start_codon:yes stop_codon:yes gene_type:complete
MLQRVRQACEASLGPDAADLAIARNYLPDELLILFHGQEPRDQRHSARTARWLLSHGHDGDRDLLTAALLHDAGKGAQRTRDRIAHVLTSWLPETLVAEETSNFEIRRALARSRAHSELGAGLLAAAGAPPRVVELTRLHHRLPGQDAMLALLQRADAAT